MYLRIFDANQVIDLDFGEYLCEIVKSKFLSKIDDYNMSLWQAHINTSEEIRKLYKNQIDIDDILIFATKHLECRFVGQDLIIEFDPNVLLPGFDRFKLGEFLKMLNFGTLSIKACPIVTDVFKYFEENISVYVKHYYNL